VPEKKQHAAISMRAGWAESGVDRDESHVAAPDETAAMAFAAAPHPPPRAADGTKMPCQRRKAHAAKSGRKKPGAVSRPGVIRQTSIFGIARLTEMRRVDCQLRRMSTRSL
jgi:hypothetical protein